MPDSAAVGRPSFAVLVATAGGIGHARPAPGTWASVAAGVVALAVVPFVPPGLLQPAFLAMAAFATVAGLATCPAAIARFARRDPAQVVIDEVAGTWLAVALVPPLTLAVEPVAAIALAVAAFRLFDIAKPWPVGWLERLPGAWGIMADDLAAGLLAGFLAVAALH
jgi:phosphatidylglycerophosphatase A